MVTHLLLSQVTQTLPGAVWTLPPLQQEGSSRGLMWPRRPGDSAPVRTHLTCTLVGDQVLSLLLPGSWRDWKGRAGSCEKAETQEEFQGEWITPGPEFISTQPQVADGSAGTGSVGTGGFSACQQLLLEDRGTLPASEGWSITAAAQATDPGGTATVALHGCLTYSLTENVSKVDGK